MLTNNDHPPHSSVSKALLSRNHGSTKETKAAVFTLVRNIELQEMIKSMPTKAILSPWQQNNICVAVAITCHLFIWSPMHYAYMHVCIYFCQKVLVCWWRPLPALLISMFLILQFWIQQFESHRLGNYFQLWKKLLIIVGKSLAL